VKRVLAMVLAGGGGEALSVLTSERAVSAVPFGGKYRVIDFLLSNCCHSELERVGILTQHAPTSLHDHIGAGRPWNLDRRDGGVFVLQPYLTRDDAGWYRGTADAIAQNWDLVERFDPERVLVLSGDHVYRMDYGPLIRAHEERRARLTLAVVRVPASESRRFGMVTLEGDGRVVRLDEKPAHTTTPFASMGIYVFDTDVLGDRLGDSAVNLVMDVVCPLVDAGEHVHAYEFTGYWEDIGQIGSYYRANLELVAPAPRLSLYDPRWPLLTRDEERPPVLVREQARVEHSLIANGCRIEGTVRRSVLFPGVRVEAGAEVSDSVVMQDVVLGRGARVDRAILDKHTRVGVGAIVGHGEAPQDPASAWLEGLTLVGKDAVIPDGGRVGRAAVIGIGVRKGELGVVVPAGAVFGSRPWYEDVV
jgi:glucose-1-phosphate adenylyltransferase